MIAVAVSGPVDGQERAVAAALSAELGPQGLCVDALVAARDRLEHAAPAFRLPLSEEASYVTGEIVPAAGDVLAVP